MRIEAVNSQQENGLDWHGSLHRRLGVVEVLSGYGVHLVSAVRSLFGFLVVHGVVHALVHVHLWGPLVVVLGVHVVLWSSSDGVDEVHESGSGSSVSALPLGLSSWRHVGVSLLLGDPVACSSLGLLLLSFGRQDLLRKVLEEAVGSGSGNGGHSVDWSGVNGGLSVDWSNSVNWGLSMDWGNRVSWGNGVSWGNRVSGGNRVSWGNGVNWSLDWGNGVSGSNSVSVALWSWGWLWSWGRSWLWSGWLWRGAMVRIRERLSMGFFPVSSSGRSQGLHSLLLAWPWVFPSQVLEDGFKMFGGVVEACLCVFHWFGPAESLVGVMVKVGVVHAFLHVHLWVEVLHRVSN